MGASLQSVKIQASVVGIVVLGAIGLSACGDGPSSRTATPTASGSATTLATAGPGTPTPRPAGSAFGPAPRLGNVITKLSPEHGKTVTQASTRTPNPRQPGGVCFETDFTKLAEANLTWYRMAFDGREVTIDVIWVVPEQTTAAKNGRACYAPAEGFPPGRHQLAVVVQDPGNPSAPSLEVIAWEFDVS